MLELKNVWVYYDKNPAVRNLSLSVKRGDFITILGANGAGKSSTLNAISGLAKVKKGEIYFKGENITGLKPAKIAARGLIQIPEGRKLFPLLTVKENLQLGAYLQTDKARIKRSMDQALTLFPILKDKLNADARMLSGGQQQMVAIARGIMAQPQMLLLDEPSLGLSPLLRQQLAEIIKEINRQGITVVLVEQNARLGLMLAAYGYVIENGRMALEGKTGDLLTNANVKKAYLGV
ncbi:MAG: ABC transporter ATP-binding protein [Desulfobacterales bacterium]|nr:ABC transporter ATP-binding protein [Desulfobacterales bacterium]